jgi:nicotinamide-nucleotide amidase
LGPTQDDLTREAIAFVLDEKLYPDEYLAQELKLAFARLGREMPASNLRQAMLIPSAKSIPNLKGTAPGWWVEKNSKVIVVMPGPPSEMRPMWQSEVFPRLKERFPSDNILTRTIKTFSLGEAKVGELCDEFFKTANPIAGIYAKPDGVQMRLIAHGDNAKQLLDSAEKKMKIILEPNVWGTGDDTLAGIVGKALSSHSKSLATIEDYSGGLLGSSLSNSKFGTGFYRGGMIVKANLVQGSIKIRPAAVNGEIAEAMAKAIREKLSADIGLSITALQENRGTGGNYDIVYVGVADSTGTKSWQQQFMVNRADSRERAVISGLYHLRERLIESGLLTYVK